MDPLVDPFSEPPQNVQRQLAETLAASLIDSLLAVKAHQKAQNAKGLLPYVVIDIYTGPLDGGQALIDPGAEFAEFAGIPHRFCPILTVQRGREIWIPVHLPDIKL
jgi:hypothetical protein